MELFKEIPIDMLRKSPTNPRRRRDPKKFEDLRASMKEEGIIQPIVVRETGDVWEIVVGEGRDKVHLHPDGTAHMIYDEPTCIGCGCTQLSPCPEGCSWTNLEEESHRGLCTSCNAKGIKFTRTTVTRVKSNGKEEASMAAKAKKKVTKKKPASKKKETGAAPAAG